MHESETIEFKESVPHRGQEDPWSQNQSLNDYAKRELLKEVVALANTYGGHVLVGIEESDDEPRRAKSVKPFVACSQLATRLESVFRDLIEPDLFGIELCGVTYDPNTDAGVLIIRVPQSRLRPHRSKADSQVYIRYGKSSLPVSMREIQDRVIQARAAVSKVEERLAGRKLAGVPSLRLEGATAAIRVTALPTSGDLVLPQPYRYTEQDLEHMTPRHAVIDGVRDYLAGSFVFDSVTAFQPILRGASRQYFRKHPLLRHEDPSDTNLRYAFVTEEVHEDGLVEIVYAATVARGESERIHPWFISGMAAHVLLAVRTMGQLAQTPGAEFLLEVRLWPRNHARHEGVTTPDRGPFRESFTLPRVVFSGNDLTTPLKMVFDDLQNCLGKPHSNSFQVDWPSR